MAGGEASISFISSSASVYVTRREKTMNFCHRRFDAGLSGHEHKYDDVRGKGFLAQTRREVLPHGHQRTPLERAPSSTGFPEILSLATRLKEPPPCPLLHR